MSEQRGFKDSSEPLQSRRLGLRDRKGAAGSLSVPSCLTPTAATWTGAMCTPSAGCCKAGSDHRPLPDRVDAGPCWECMPAAKPSAPCPGHGPHTRGCEGRMCNTAVAPEATMGLTPQETACSALLKVANDLGLTCGGLRVSVS